MMKKGIKLPIAILPVGTANDFGKFIGMPSDVQGIGKFRLFQSGAAGNI